MMGKRALCISALAIVVGLTGCSPAVPLPTPTPSKPATVPPTAPTSAAGPAKPAAPTRVPVTLKYGGTPVSNSIGLFLALEKGYFQEQGINLQLVTFSTAGEEIAPLGTGELDVAGAVFSPGILNAVDRGIQVKMVANHGTFRQGFDAGWIMLRKDLADSGQVKSPGDLKGQRLAMTTRYSLSHHALDLMLAPAGLTEKDVAGGSYENLGFADIVAGFGNKSIGAAFVVEPFVSSAEVGGLAVKWFSASSLFPGNAVDTPIIAYSPKTVGDKDLGGRWMVAYLKGVRDYLQLRASQQGKDQINAAIGKYTPTKDPKVLDRMEIVYLNPNGTMDMSSLKLRYDYMVKAGAYQGKTTLQDVVDTSFIDYAVQVLGKYQ